MGIVRTETSDVPLDLYGLRTGGIGDIGSFAELSYDLIPSKEFADYSRKRTVMLIDPSGECEFDTGSNSNVRCSKPDIARGKTVFRNIFWDADGSGSDVFTFAYYDGIAVEAFAVHIVVVVLAIVRHCKGCIVILDNLQLLSIFNLIVNRKSISLATCILDAAWV
mgnify:FL=1